MYLSIQLLRNKNEMLSPKCCHIHKKMKVISWNVNGIRAVNKKNVTGAPAAPDEMTVIAQMIDEHAPDVLCLQEIKTDNPNDLSAYKDYFKYIAVNSAQKKGYSGTAILSKEEPLKVTKDFEAHPILKEQSANFSATKEGRVLTAEFATLNVICCYTVNAKMDLSRIDERQQWDEMFKQHIILTEQATGKPCVVVGDLNVAHKPCDLYANKKDCRTAGLSTEERQGFTDLLEHAELIDAYRFKNPTGRKWTWWSPITQARERDIGWRIDYTLVSKSLQESLTEVDILDDYYGSDHCPVLVTISK
jgi:exodeoxyribonuclease-3